MLEPQFQHHQHPHHRSVIRCMNREMLVEQPIDEISANDTATAQRRQVVRRQRSELAMALQPCTHGKAKSVLLLGDGFRGQEVCERLLEEIAQMRSPKL